MTHRIQRFGPATSIVSSSSVQLPLIQRLPSHLHHMTASGASVQLPLLNRVLIQRVCSAASTVQDFGSATYCIQLFGSVISPCLFNHLYFSQCFGSVIYPYKAFLISHPLLHPAVWLSFLSLSSTSVHPIIPFGKVYCRMSVFAEASCGIDIQWDHPFLGAASPHITNL